MTKEQIERAINAIIGHALRGGAYEQKVHDFVDQLLEASVVAPIVGGSADCCAPVRSTNLREGNMGYKIPIHPKVSSLFVCEKCGCSKIAIEFWGWQCKQGEHKFIEMIKVMSGVWR